MAGVMLALALGSGTARGQGSGVSAACPAGSADQRATQDGCQKARDLFAFIVPELGATIVGGNASLGEGGAFGGIGRFAIGVRANVISARLPRVDRTSVSIGGAAASDYSVAGKAFVFPTAEGSLGLFGGFPIGSTNIFALDGLVTATWVPNVAENALALETPDGAIRFGFGGRLGLLQESLVTPSIAVTYVRRDLPAIDAAARSGSDELFVDDVAVRTQAWRIVAGKSLAVFSLMGGAGRDRYTSSGSIRVKVSQLGQSFAAGPISVAQAMTRTNLFGGISVNLPGVNVAAEVGRASGGEVHTFNTFSGKRADDAFTYGSVGVRLGF
jgi:hypothetical protein